VVIKVPGGVVHILASGVGFGGDRSAVLAERRVGMWRRSEDVREGGDGVCGLSFGGGLAGELVLNYPACLGSVGGTLRFVLLEARSPSLGRPSTRELARLAGLKLSSLGCLPAIG
jgi:hypothetical protein